MEIKRQIVESKTPPSNKEVWWFDTNTEALKRYSSGKWEIIQGGDSTPSDTIIETTYNDLLKLINENKLIPGTWYEFEYSDIYEYDASDILLEACNDPATDDIVTKSYDLIVFKGNITKIKVLALSSEYIYEHCLVYESSISKWLPAQYNIKTVTTNNIIIGNYLHDYIYRAGSLDVNTVKDQFYNIESADNSHDFETDIENVKAVFRKYNTNPYTLGFEYTASGDDDVNHTYFILLDVDSHTQDVIDVVHKTTIEMGPIIEININPSSIEDLLFSPLDNTGEVYNIQYPNAKIYNSCFGNYYNFYLGGVDYFDVHQLLYQYDEDMFNSKKSLVIDNIACNNEFIIPISSDASILGSITHSKCMIEGNNDDINVINYIGPLSSGFKAINSSIKLSAYETIEGSDIGDWWLGFLDRPIKSFLENTTINNSNIECIGSYQLYYYNEEDDEHEIFLAYHDLCNLRIDNLVKPFDLENDEIRHIVFIGLANPSDYEDEEGNVDEDNLLGINPYIEKQATFHINKFKIRNDIDSLQGYIAEFIVEESVEYAI